MHDLWVTPLLYITLNSYQFYTCIHVGKANVKYACTHGSQPITKEQAKLPWVVCEATQVLYSKCNYSSSWKYLHTIHTSVLIQEIDTN